MTDFARHIEDYLRLRRQLGYKLKAAGEVLPQLVAYLDAAGASTLTAELAISWARLPQGVKASCWAHRLAAARGFANYLQALEPATEVAPGGIWRSSTRRPGPYLYSESDVRHLLEAARRLQPSLRAKTHETLFGLLAATGMRVGEALGLQRADVDFAEGVLTIRNTKFGHSRVVPLHPTMTAALCSYAAYRDQLSPRPRAGTFFISSLGRAVLYRAVCQTFDRLRIAAGLHSGNPRPRIHDLRHSFAVNTLIEWYRSGADVHGQMAVLSAYLGHINPANTYWYLSATPELMELASARLDHRFGGQQ
jgi:integrase/recombinase XerD